MRATGPPMTTLSLILPCFDEAERLPASCWCSPAAGSPVALLDGRRMLGEVWAARRATGSEAVVTPVSALPFSE
jgi:hypothetical protein